MDGKVVQAEVQDIDVEGGQARQVLTDQGPLPCDRVVLATGVWSGPLMQKLGIKVPLETERGYHIVFQNPEGRAALAHHGGGRKIRGHADGGRSALCRDRGIRRAGGRTVRGPADLLRKRVPQAFPKASPGRPKTPGWAIARRPPTACR